MRIIITRNTFVAGKLVEADPKPVEVPEAEAKQLLALGKAIQAPAVPVAAETPAKESAPPSDSEAKDDKSKDKEKAKDK